MSPTFRLSPAVTSRCGDAQSQAHKGFDSICHLVTYLSYRNKEKEIGIYKAERISKTEVTGDKPPLKGLAMQVCASLRSQVTLGDNQVTNHLARAA